MNDADNPVNPRQQLFHVVRTLFKVENHLKVIQQGLLHEDSAIHFCDVVDSTNQLLQSAALELDAILLHIVLLEHQGILPPSSDEKPICFEEWKWKLRQKPLEPEPEPQESEPEPLALEEVETLPAPDSDE